MLWFMSSLMWLFIVNFLLVCVQHRRIRHFSKCHNARKWVSLLLPDCSLKNILYKFLKPFLFWLTTSELIKSSATTLISLNIRSLVILLYLTEHKLKKICKQLHFVLFSCFVYMYLNSTLFSSSALISSIEMIYN